MSNFNILVLLKHSCYKDYQRSFSFTEQEMLYMAIYSRIMHILSIKQSKIPRFQR